MVWNIFYFPYIGNNHPNWLPYFSVVLKPPTSSKSRDDHGIKMDTVNHLPTGAGFFFHPGMVQHPPSTLGKKKLKCEVICRCSVLLIKAKDFWWWWWRRRGWWWPWHDHQERRRVTRWHIEFHSALLPGYFQNPQLVWSHEQWRPSDVCCFTIGTALW